MTLHKVVHTDMSSHLSSWLYCYLLVASHLTLLNPASLAFSTALLTMWVATPARLSPRSVDRIYVVASRKKFIGTYTVGRRGSGRSRSNHHLCNEHKLRSHLHIEYLPLSSGEEDFLALLVDLPDEREHVRQLGALDARQLLGERDVQLGGVGNAVQHHT